MTSEVKHTPGPWRTDENGSIVCYPDGQTVGVLSRQLPEEELKANHLLIVAAPDLLAALKGMLDEEEDFLVSIYRAEAAISKATA